MDVQSQSQTQPSSADNSLKSATLNFVNNAQTFTSTVDAEDSIRRSLHLNQRDTSPSRLSIHSTSTTSTSPQLKRKLGHSHIRNQLRVVQNLSAAPILKPSTSDNNPTVVQTDTSPSRLSRAQLSRAHSSPRRPPASHSSYGIETNSGPPPSFDTQRTRSQERVWRGDRSKSLRISNTLDRAEAQKQLSTTEKRDNTDPIKQPSTTFSITRLSSDDTGTPQTPHSEEVVVMETPIEQGVDLGRSEKGSKTSSESHKSEDIFLNIARVDTARETPSRSEKRKSRVSLPYYSSVVRPATSYESSVSQRETEVSITPRAQLKVNHRQRASIGTPSGELYPQSLPGLLGTSDIGSDKGVNGTHSKRSSTLYADTIRPTQRSTTSLRSNRLISETGHSERPKFGDRNATESSVSTAAPSTVWDELDDLKSRIRKLELTGKLPQSSAAAMSSVERPRTATTAATTMSASPKHNTVTTPLQSTIEGVPSTVHPLLHEALANAKSIVSHDVYQKLQATAQDSLQLAAMTSFDNNGVRNGVSAAADRQLRRRTESMCRNLTELAIALASESRSTQPPYRPSSRDYHISPHVGLRSRRYSQENESSDRLPFTSRVHSRLDTRRASTQTGSVHVAQVSPERESPASLPQQHVSQARALRPSGTFRNRRAQNFLDGANDKEDPASGPAVRPVSRAMTDVAGIRRSSRDHAGFSREYTSQHPMPTLISAASVERSPLPSNLSTNFISRRKFSSPVHSAAIESSPLAPKQSWSRISIVNQENNDSSPRSVESTSEEPKSARSVTTRRSFGFASRLGSTVGSRLRASKFDRAESRSTKMMPEIEVTEQLDNA